MKKIILVLIIFIACYFIYNLTIDKKVSYLTLGDILSKGTNEYGVSNTSSTNYGNIYFRLYKYAKAVIDNPNFRSILDAIYKN